MSGHDAELRRYAALADRLALGESLSADERAFVEHMQRTHEVARVEHALLSELSDLSGPPSEATRALVEAALAHAAQPTSTASRNDARKRADRNRSSRRAYGRVTWLSATAALAACAGLLLAWPWSSRSKSKHEQPQARIELVYLSGDVRVGDRPASASSTLLREGDVLTVGDGSACVAMDPAIDVCASAGTRLRLTAANGPWRRLDLLSGKVAAQLGRQPDGERFSIVSDEVWSTAIGTAFTVERARDAHVQTTVLSGQVRVGEREARNQLVEAHQRVRVARGQLESGKRSAVTAISRSEESPDWALLGPTKLWTAQVAATLEVSGAPAGAEVVLDGQRIGLAPLSTLVPVGTHRVEVRSDGGVLWSGLVSLSAGQREQLAIKHKRAAEATRELTSTSTLEPAQPALSAPRALQRKQQAARHALPQASEQRDPLAAASILGDARARLRDRKWSEAAALYERLLREHPDSAESRSGLLSLAELQLERLGEPAAALKSADRYLSLGGGALSPEAQATRIRALRALGRKSDERSAIEAYLSAHPDSLRARELGRRLLELQPAPRHEGSSP